MIFPVADLYDSGMMQMYINAAREQYNQGRQDMKEFIDKYGDFVSPFQEDINWVDNETRGRVNNALNYLYQNGIDPLRSAEGRALIQRVINNTDRAGINARRQSAENKKAWDKLAGEMKAKGQYNNDFINWYFNNKYGVTPDQWSTEKNGVFSETSPLVYQDLNQYTGHIFDKMEDQFIESVMEPDGKFDYSGVSEARRREALTPQLRGLTSTDLGRYHYELARQDAARKLGRVPTEDEVMQQYQDNIITSTKEYERRKREENKEYARARNFYYANALDAAKTARDLKKDKALRANTPGFDANGNAISNPQNQVPNTYTQQVTDDAIAQLNRTGGNIGRTMSETFGDIKKYYSKNAKQLKWWSDVEKSYNSAKTDKERENVLHKAGLHTWDGKITNRFKRAIDNSLAVARGTDYKWQDKQRAATTVDSYDAFGARILAQDVTGTNKEPYNGKGNKWLTANFGNSNINYSRIRGIETTTGAKLTKGSLSNRFHNFLKQNNIKGWVVNQHTTATLLPDRSIDVNGEVSVPLTTLRNFAKSVGKDDSNESLARIASQLGLRLTDKFGSITTVPEDTDKADATVFVQIPTSTTVPNDGGQIRGKVDDWYNKWLVGAGETSKRQSTVQAISRTGM